MAFNRSCRHSNPRFAGFHVLWHALKRRSEGLTRASSTNGSAPNCRNGNRHLWESCAHADWALSPTRLCLRNLLILGIVAGGMSGMACKAPCHTRLGKGKQHENLGARFCGAGDAGVSSDRIFRPPMRPTHSRRVSFADFGVLHRKTA